MLSQEVVGVDEIGFCSVVHKSVWQNLPWSLLLLKLSGSAYYSLLILSLS